MSGCIDFQRCCCVCSDSRGLPSGVCGPREDLPRLGDDSIADVCKSAARLIEQDVLLIVRGIRWHGRQVGGAGPLSVQRLDLGGGEDHSHAALGVEDRRRIAAADIDIPAQCPLLAVRACTRPARPHRCDVSVALARRTVGFHIERGDTDARRWVRTRHTVEPFDNHRIPGAITFGEKVANHRDDLSAAGVN